MDIHLLAFIYFSGKSNFICGLLTEFRSHFVLDNNNDIKNIYYYHLESCENTTRLKHEFSKAENIEISLKISKKLPDNLVDVVLPKSIVVLDDLESVVLSNTSLIKQLHHFSSVLCHHKQIFLFFVAQSVSILKKSSKLNTCVGNATHFVLGLGVGVDLA